MNGSKNGNIVLAFAAAATALLFSTPSYAWSALTHVLLAERILDEAASKGGVTVVETEHWPNPEAGANPVYGPYALDRFDRLRPAAFRNGLLCGDAYSDIVSGQRSMHPDPIDGGAGADAWLQHLWDVATTIYPNSDTIRSFVLGCLVHAAGDLFAHTLVNKYVGGAFNVVPPYQEQALGHIAIEAYIDQRAPRPRSVDLTLSSTERAELFDFIYLYMIDAQRARNGRAQTRVWDLSNSTWTQTIPGVFTRLREALKDDVEAYDQRVEALADRIDQLTSERNALPIWNWWRRAELTGEIEALRMELRLFTSTRGLWRAYQEAWIHDIDVGLRAWPEVSQVVAGTMLLPPLGPDGKPDRDSHKASDALVTFGIEHLVSMAGAPDQVGAALGLIREIKEIIDRVLGPVKEFLDELKDDIRNAVAKAATGRSWDEWKELLADPKTWLDNYPPLAGKRFDGLSVRAHLEQQMGVTSPDQHFNPEALAPAYNTIVLSKLALVSPAEFDRFRNEAKVPAYQSVRNLMLGFMRSLDGSNEHNQQDRPRMVLAEHCATYQRFFKSQLGDHADEGTRTIFRADGNFTGRKPDARGRPCNRCEAYSCNIFPHCGKPDGCGGFCDCGGDPSACRNGVCCRPYCPQIRTGQGTAVACGVGDGCGGTCTCPPDQACSNGVCAPKPPPPPPCSPACSDATGHRCEIPNGCGGSCTCPTGQTCQGGYCIRTQCQFPCECCTGYRFCAASLRMCEKVCQDMGCRD